MISTTRITVFTILWLLFAILHSHLLFRALLPLTCLFCPTNAGLVDYLFFLVLSLLALPLKDILLRKVLGLQLQDWYNVNFLALFFASGLTVLYIGFTTLLFSLLHLPGELIYMSIFFVFRLSLHSAQYFGNPAKLPKSWFHARLFSAFLLACAFPFNIADYAAMKTDSISAMFFMVMLIAEFIIIYSDIQLRMEQGKHKTSLHFPLKSK